MSNDKDEKKKAKYDKFTILAVIGLACLVLFAENDPLIDLTPRDHPPVEYIPVSANVELYKFECLATNTSANIELWIINIGDETATNISVYVRTRDYNGTILFSENISLTALVLRANETCSGAYIIIFDNSTAIINTIEISWTDGRNSYQRI